MKQDASVALFHYWDRLRSGRPAPQRAEIEPSDIKTLLADTFILERDTRGEAIFRLAGTRLCAMYGRELKGFLFPSLWRSTDQRMVAKLAESVFDCRGVVVVDYDGISQRQNSVNLELLLLPLAGDTGHRRALGIISAQRSPYWLGNDPLSDAKMNSVRVVDPDREPLFLKNCPAVPVPSLAPNSLAASQNSILQTGARRIRHLVVLPGGRNGD